MLNDPEGTLSNVEAMANNPQFSEPVSSSGKSETKQDDKEPSSLQESVKKIVDAAREDDPAVEVDPSAAPADPAQKPESEGQVGQGGDEEPAKEAAPEGAEEDEQLKGDDARLDKHPRFQELIQERQVNRPYVEFAKADEAFCKQYSVTDQQRKEAMELVALVNTNPKEAVARLQRAIEELQTATGERLPADLQELVAQGKMDEGVAKDFAKQRLELNRERQAMARSQQEREQQVAQQRMTALNQWDANKRKQDPDFKPKVKATDPDGKWEMVLKEMKLLAMDNPPKNTQEAVEQVEQAYKTVSSIFSRLAPPSRSRRNLTSSGSSQPEPKTTEAKSMQEYVQKAIGRKHGIRLGSDN